MTAETKDSYEEVLEYINAMEVSALALVATLQNIILDAAANAYILSEQFINDANALEDEDVLFVFDANALEEDEDVPFVPDYDKTSVREVLSFFKNLINTASNMEYREAAKYLMRMSDGSNSVIWPLVDVTFNNDETLVAVALGDEDETGSQPLLTLPRKVDNTVVPMLQGYVNDFEFFREGMFSSTPPHQSYYVNELLKATVNCYNAIAESFLSCDRIDDVKLFYRDGQICANSDAHHLTSTRDLITAGNSLVWQIQECTGVILEIMGNQPVETAKNKPETRKNKGGRPRDPQNNSIANTVEECGPNASDEDICKALDLRKIFTPGNWIKEGCPRSWVAARNDEAKDENSKRIFREKIRKMLARHKKRDTNT